MVTKPHDGVRVIGKLVHYVRADNTPVLAKITALGAGDLVDLVVPHAAGGLILDSPGTSGHNATTPDAPKFGSIGDLSLRGFAVLKDWTPAVDNRFIAKWGGDRSYHFGVGTSGVLRIGYSTDGTNEFGIDSSVAATFTNGVLGGIRADFDVDAGATDHEVTFFTAVGLGKPWVQLGTVINNAGVVTINSGTDVLEVGASDNGGFGQVDGRISNGQVFDGIVGGTLVGHFNAEDFAVGDGDTDTAVAATGETWTLNGTDIAIQRGETFRDIDLLAAADDTDVWYKSSRRHP